MLVAGVEEGVVVVRAERNGAEGVGKDCEVGFEAALEKLVEKPKEDCEAEEAGVPKEEKLEAVVDGGAAVVGVEVVGFKRGEDVGNVKAEEEVEKLWNDWVVGATEDEGWDEEAVPNSGEGALGAEDAVPNSCEAEVEEVPNRGVGALGANEVAPNGDEVAEEGAPNRGETEAVEVGADEDEPNRDWDGVEPNRGVEAVEAEEPNRERPEDAADENPKEGVEAEEVVVVAAAEAADENPNEAEADEVVVLVEEGMNPKEGAEAEDVVVVVVGAKPKEGVVAELGFEDPNREEEGVEVELREKENGDGEEEGLEGVEAPKAEDPMEKPVVDVVAGVEDPNGEAEGPNEKEEGGLEKEKGEVDWAEEEEAEDPDENPDIVFPLLLFSLFWWCCCSM